MIIHIPSRVKFIIDTLYKHNFEAFMVGGCVRDSLLNKTPNDYDITTNALPKDIISIFNKTIPTGLKHGTVTIILDNESYETTTYRIDGEYINNRKPKDVIFVSNIKEDLSRRDFTINAMAYNHRDGLIDYFNGQKDLKEGLVKCVGDPTKRFNEDALRMLRAIRFSSQLGFKIDSDTLSAINTNNELLKNISKERINVELTKILLSPNSSHGLNLLLKTNLLFNIFPVNKTSYDFSILDKSSNKLYIRLSLLLNILNITYNNCENILKSLTYDNNTINKVLTILKNINNVVDINNRKDIKLLINNVSKDLILDFIEIQKLLLIVDNVYEKNLITIYKNILYSHEPLCIKDLSINGSLLMQKLDMKPGKEIGEILNYLLDAVLENPNLNNMNKLLELAKKYKK